MKKYVLLTNFRLRNNRQNFTVFKVSIVFFVLAMQSLTAATYSQRLTLQQRHATVGRVIKEIKTQTGMDVLWQAGHVDITRLVDANFLNTPIEDVLNKLKTAQHADLKWRIKDNAINLSKSSSNSLLQDSLIFKGIVKDEKSNPMAGATIKVRGGSKSTFSKANGSFSIAADSKDILEVSFIGYLTHQITLNGWDHRNILDAKMVPGQNTLGEVSIVSTGYQDVPKERATGSFEVITKEQLQHSTDPNIIRRLEGITTSMDFNNNLIRRNSAALTLSSADPASSPLAKLTIRGKNTLNPIQTSMDNQSGRVLVVIDGIANPYPIDNINPNDVESITVLKDAAAASIWGSRAANGVIVVKTKKGNYSQPLNVSFTTNVNLTEKLDLFSKGLMTTSDFVDAQIFQFRALNTRINPPNINSSPPFISPVAAILGRAQNGQITNSEATAQLNILRNNDVRRDYEDFVLRKALTQTYSIALDGGSKFSAWRFSMGYDNTDDNSISSNGSRLTLNGGISLKPIKNLDLGLSAIYTTKSTANQAPEGALSATVSVPYYLYTRLKDDNGNSLTIPYTYRQDFLSLLQTTYGTSIPELSYNPLENIKEGYNKFRFNNLNFNANINYKIVEPLSLSVIYNYGTGSADGSTLYRKNSFYTRSLVARYTSPNGEQAIPNGGIYTLSENPTKQHSGRAQLNLSKLLNEKHSIDAIGGVEITQSTSLYRSLNYYGYDERTLESNNQLNYRTTFPFLFSTGVFGSSGTIPYIPTGFLDSKIRTFSSYANVAYTYAKKYTLSSSIRKDLSSEFGVGTNKGGTPFYSFGGKWDVSKESFYPFGRIVPSMQLRTTFGYNGNVNPLVSARQLIDLSFGTQDNFLFSASPDILSATNPQLRPEKTGILNVGLDLAFMDNRVTLSVEYYDKKTTDLIASNILDPTTSFSSFSYNTADMHAWGTDLTLNSLNITNGKFSWRSLLLYSHNRVKVAKVYSPTAKTAGDVVLGSPIFNEGADLSRLYGYRSAGLDPRTGSLRGYYNGQPIVVDNSTFSLIANQPLSSARYFGSSVPVHFGSLRNTFQYGLLSVSANLMYKFGYYFRRPVFDMVSYSTLFTTAPGANRVQGAEYASRWQLPGDQLKTNVPGLIFPTRSLADNFYTNSDLNILKADHIRFQEINIAIALNNKKWLLKNARVYANITNLGVIWRANNMGLDPEVNDYPNPRTYSIGLNANF